MARAPPFPFLRKAGPIPGSFWAVPGLLMCGPDPRWERRGATERLEDDFRIAEVVSDDVVVQARNLAPHLIEGPLVYVCGRGSRALAAYLLAQLYDLPLALACVDLERLGARWASNYLRKSEWRALLRAFGPEPPAPGRRPRLRVRSLLGPTAPLVPTPLHNPFFPVRLAVSVILITSFIT